MGAVSPGSRPPAVLPDHRRCPDLPPGTCSAGCQQVGQRILHRNKFHNPVLENRTQPTSSTTKTSRERSSIQPGRPQASASLAEEGTVTTVDLNGLFRVPKQSPILQTSSSTSLAQASCQHPVPKTQHPNLPPTPACCVKTGNGQSTSQFISCWSLKG